MKYYYLFILFFAGIFYSCEKSNSEIAPIDNLSSIAYMEKIYAQPVVVDNHIISIQNQDGSVYLKSFSENGSILWSTNINEYIIDGESYETVPYLELSKNKNNEIFVNFYGENHYGSEMIKSVRFSFEGEYISDFTDTVHQDLPNVVPEPRQFQGLGILTLDNGNVAVVSSLTILSNQLTFIQVSEYNENGNFLHDTIYEIDRLLQPIEVFLASDNRFVFRTGLEYGITRFAVFNPESGDIDITPELPVLDLFSFYENSKGNFIITASAFDNDLDYFGIIISFSDKGEYLWHRVYTEQSPWLFTNITEVANGYIFSGFDDVSKSQLLKVFDWRTGFDGNRSIAVFMKTNFEGISNNNVGWINRFMLPASTAGAAVLKNENGNYTLFAGKYDKEIYSTIILKVNNNGEILN